MKKIDKLLENLNYEVLTGKIKGDISELVYDTRKASKDCIFVCVKGAVYDSHEHLQEIIDAKTKVIVIEKGNVAAKEFLSRKKVKKTTIITVEDSREALAVISAAYFDHPASKLKVIGITGTKGKTTTTYMVKSILENAGFSVGLIGTIEIIYADYQEAAKNTTPESYELQRHFAAMVEKGVEFCVMEVSSQALMLNRVAGFTFEVGIFTNISPDHIGPNEHDSFEHYLQCKALLFKNCNYAIINGDDDEANYIIERTSCKKITYGFNESNDLYASNMELINDKGCLGVTYNTNGIINTDIRINMPGKFSVYNSMTAIAICNYLGVSEDKMKPALLAAKVKGRIEMMDVSDKYTLLIDYAHNAVSLEALLKSLREYNPKRLVVLFGCGGNRAKGRRFTMGEAAAKFADFAVITSDNPRNEEPQAIINDIIVGYSYGKNNKKIDFEEVTDKMVEEARIALKDYRKTFTEIPDRVEAIGYIMTNAKPGDLVVLAGKGHEDYQEIEGEKHHLDEREVVEGVKQALEKFRIEVGSLQF